MGAEFFGWLFSLDIDNIVLHVYFKLLYWKIGFFGLCYAMDWGYKRCNPYLERHLAIFVNCF
jgi:hypothetical protein